MNGLLGILPKRGGITHDSLLTGDIQVGVSLVAKPVPTGTSNLYRMAHPFRTMPRPIGKLTYYPAVCDLFTAADGIVW
jgi:hypothetical protein